MKKESMIFANFFDVQSKAYFFLIFFLQIFVKAIYAGG